ncbi:unnamed protein product [Mytilus coruscus]|uniref:Reverse transcriptase zinc-binding domain-containing protein n=1 Tax=Mytilus coruscus TaxID=42192 RepID=A0A6J8BJF0_MYTCO|nr:unnamed protein product [Mytilus coruscus]
MLNVVDAYSKEHQYNIHPEKSVLIKQNENSTNSRKTSICSWSLGDRSIAETDKTSHLGILRSSKYENLINVEDRISLARRTSYSLMSTGVHGTNGLNPRISYNIYRIYILPRLLYSLEVLPLTAGQINALGDFHLSFLKNIQALPTRTASVAVYLLLGALPIVAEIHKRQLSILHSILDSENQNLRDILMRHIGETHPVWKTATEIPGETKKAITKARILTWTYLVQATKAKFNKGSTDPICTLCKLEEENLQHYLTRCPTLEGVRRTFYAPLKQAQFSLLFMLFENFPWTPICKVLALIAACVVLQILWKRRNIVRQWDVIVFYEPLEDPWEELLGHPFVKQKAVIDDEATRIVTLRKTISYHYRPRIDKSGRSSFVTVLCIKFAEQYASMAVILLASIVAMILVQPWSVNNPIVELNEPEFVFDPTDLEFIDFEEYSLIYMLFENFSWKTICKVLTLIAAYVVLQILWKRRNTVRQWDVIIFYEPLEDPWEELLGHPFAKQKAVQDADMAVILVASLVAMVLMQPWVVNIPAVELKEPEFVFDPSELEFIDYEDFPRFEILSWTHFCIVSTVFVITSCVVFLLLWKRSNEEHQDIFDHCINNNEELDIEEIEGYVTSYVYLQEDNWEDIMRNIQMLRKSCGRLN